MPRPPRIQAAGDIVHVYARGARRGPIYFDRPDRFLYLAMLASTARVCEWRVLAYCLMTNHVHLLLETPHENLSVGMHRFHGRYAQRLNQRHRMSGHVFDRRFGSVRVEGDGQFWMTARYLAMNPVEAGIVANPEDYEWSSYGHVIRRQAPALLDTDRLLELFAASGGEALERYQDLVAGPRF